ncbi:MAG: uracil-DNA glycosylase [Gemmobacter sp.]
MGIAADIEGDWHAALAALAWQADLGLTEVVGEGPASAYDLPDRAPWLVPVLSSVAPLAVVAEADPVAVARRLAALAPDLAALHAAIAGYDHCELKKGARSTVFADGNPAARVLVLGEAPGRDEDLAGLPFVGAAGQMLDRMLGAIGLSRTAPAPEAAVYITNVMPWRPPQNRDPEAGEIAMMLPFVERHVALADPEVIVLMGNTSCLAALGQKGISRLRGVWTTAFGRSALPMFHPAYLLRNPAAKREAWTDLLALQAWLRG